MTLIHGGCLCGQVRYHITAEPMLVAVCHCRHCQKQSGSAFSVNLLVASDRIQIEGQLKDYTDRGEADRLVTRRFCPECGSAVATELEMLPGTVVIKAGTLDDPSSSIPTVHMWCDHRQPWTTIPESTTQLARNPSP